MVRGKMVSMLLQVTLLVLYWDVACCRKSCPPVYCFRLRGPAKNKARVLKIIWTDGCTSDPQEFG